MNCPHVSVSSVCLKGTVSDASGCPPEVNVDGTPVPVNVTGNNGTWQKDDVPLPSNPTQINVSTQDATANTRSLTITVQNQ